MFSILLILQVSEFGCLVMDKENAKILIVDDEMINIKILVATLENYECIIAKNGKKAISLANGESPPDLILLDVMMPSMNGYEVCRQLKSNPLTEAIPIIFITSKGDVKEERIGLELGAVDYIVKPFSPEIVKARVTNNVTLKKQRDLLERLNVTDHLTGIANRRCFDDTLDYEYQSARRSGSSLSLILVDIDLFKAVNDTGGHVFGDECLKKIANALSKSVSRSTDFVSRYGGEEFAVVLPSTDGEGALEAAEKMRSNVESLHIPHPSNGEPITISLGVSTLIPSKEMSPELIIKQADAKLYEAKESGRNKVCS
jgi:diguanylate cyclase (GGDEF)-like protein